MLKGNGGGEYRAKVKLRVIEFELEGANSSVESSVRQLTSALSTRSSGVAAGPPQARAQPALTAVGEESEPVRGTDVEPDRDSEDFVASPAKAHILPQASISPRTP